jgi:WD40 repeat protein
VAVSARGDRIASASADGTVIIWDSQSWDKVVVLMGHRGSSCSGGVYAVAWNHAGDRLASCASDKLIVVWDAVSWAQIQTLKGHADSVRDLVWSGSDLISCSFDQSIRIWDTTAWSQKKIFLWHSPMKCITVSPDGKSLASGSLDATVVVWHLETSTLVTLVGHEADVSGIAWRPASGQLASCSWDGLIILWQASTGEKLANFVAEMGSGHSAPLRGLSWSADGSRISSCKEGVVHVWDVPWQNFEQTAPAVTGHTESVRFLHWNGAKLCSCSEDGTSKIWKKGLEVATLRPQGGGVLSVSWSAEGDKLAACSADRTCTIWDAVSFSLIHTLRESDAPKVHDDEQTHDGSGDYNAASAKVQAIHFASASCAWIGGRIAASLQSRKILIWDAVTGTCTATIKGHSGAVNSICFCASRSLLASGSDDSNIRVWSALSHEHQATLQGHVSGISQVRWTTKGDKLASASADETVILWDCHRWTALTSLKGHTGIVWTVAFCPAGDQIVSGGFDGVINVWDVHTHEALATFCGWKREMGVNCVEFSPLGKELASASGDGKIVIFDRRVVVDSGTGSAAAMDVEIDTAGTSKQYEEHVISQLPPPASASASGNAIQPQSCPTEVSTLHQRRAINTGEWAGLSSGTLASLVVHCEELSAEETTSLVSLLPVNTSLTSLALYGLQTGHEGQFVPDGIRMLTQLTSLRITNSALDFAAARLVRGATNVLHSTVSLKHLDLERNRIGPSGATGLAKALSWLTSLRGLRLGYNSMQDAGGHEIAKAVSRLSSLSELGMESNSFTPAGVFKIAEDLASLPDLIIALQDASLTSDYVDSMPASRHEECNIRMTLLPPCLVEAFEPAGVPGMRFKHGIRGNMPHTLAVTFDMEAFDLDTGLPWWRQRLWLAWFGAPGVGSAHWIMSDRFCDILCV